MSVFVRVMITPANVMDTSSLQKTRKIAYSVRIYYMSSYQGARELILTMSGNQNFKNLRNYKNYAGTCNFFSGVCILRKSI